MDLSNMDDQMKLFQEGGIADDGMERDPVSGNEVPPGSLSKEVRDDVDAKLSEGEYVVPADVVRFFGVDYFEKLRKKAKEGLAQMDKDGRIGGEPLSEEDDEEEDDLPFSEEELAFLEEDEDAPVGMAEGGLVEQFKKELSSQRDIADWRDQKEGFLSAEEHSKRLETPQSETYTPVKEGFKRPFLKKNDPVIDRHYSNSPTMQSYVDGEMRGNDLEKEGLSGLSYLQQLTLELEELSNREASGEISKKEQKLLDSYRKFFTPRVGMAEGGAVQGFAKGFEQEMTEPSVQTETYKNETGEQRTIMFVGGQPIQKIPEGFTKVSKGNLTNKPENAKVSNRPEDRERGVGTDSTDAGFGNESGTAVGGFADAMAGAMDSALGTVTGTFSNGANSEGGAAASSGPSVGASDSGPNGGMGGYAARGMLVNRKVKQKSKK